MIEKLYLLINILTGCIILILGFKFFLARHFFKYHVQICKMQWDELNKEKKTLILSLMHAVGACLFPLAFVFLGCTLKLYYKFDINIQIILTLMGVILFSGLFYVTFNIYKKTKANTPWILVLALLICNLISLISQFI